MPRRGAHSKSLDAVAREESDQEGHHLVVRQVAREERGPGEGGEEGVTKPYLLCTLLLCV